MNKFLIYFLTISGFIMVLISSNSYALPKYKVEHDKNAHGIAKIRLNNETVSTLACHVSIDGYKKKFVLPPFQSSKWYIAADKQFNHTNFRTWCDLIDFYPHYEKYRH